MELIIQLFRYKRCLVEKAHIWSVTTYQEQIDPAKEHREHEFQRCFQHNLSLPYVNKIHVFLENPQDQSHFTNIAGEHLNKCVFIPFGRQPHYRNLLEYAKTLPDDIIFCIMNSDILLDEKNDFSLIKKHVTGTNGFGLTRHEYTTPDHEVCNVHTCMLLHDYHGSHDMFILQNPLLTNIDMNAIDFKQNTGGAEAIFQKTLKNAGYSLKNPSFQIRGFHIHSPRNYFEDYRIIGTDVDYSEQPSMLV